MKHLNLLIAVAIMASAIFSCRKDNDQPPPPGPDDRREVRLREVVTPSLPSPYYQFVYDANGFITNINFASNMFQYRVSYASGRVKKMVNLRNNDELNYVYENGAVAQIMQTSLETGKKKWHYKMLYYPNGKLKSISWSRFTDDKSDSTVLRRVILIYDDNGNLGEYDDYRKATNSNDLLWARTTEFSEYDDKVNVEDIYLFKDFFEDLVFLPQVKLQTGNPRTIRVTSNESEYVITNTFQYDGKRPVKKTYHLQVLRGNNPHFDGMTEYYY